MKIRLPDIAYVFNEEKECRTIKSEINDSILVYSIQNSSLKVSIIDNGEALTYIVLKWFLKEDEKRHEPIRILGDAWERGYGDLEWRGIVQDRSMPWNCLVSNGSDTELDYTNRHTEGFGVKVRPSAFCSWQYLGDEVVLFLDIRCGAKGVLLNGKTLDVAEVLFKDFYNQSAYQSGCDFCKLMCTDPIFPKETVYGFNNWYYAYGVSSDAEIMEDTERLVTSCQGTNVKPYMVLDDGWQINRADAPWDRGNSRFPDMRALAEKIKQKGARPGIWIRPLSVSGESCDIPVQWRLEREPRYLDPSRPEVLKYVAKCVSTLTDWGYELIKYDFVTFDIIGKWGFSGPGVLADGNWSFYNRSKTTAEIIVDLYRCIRNASSGAVLIGCNAIGHLCAGMVEINRTGDDTSGKDWKRTRRMGINTLAFRSIQNRAFYMADADCVPITPAVSFQVNRHWLKLLSASDSPLFISWNPLCNDEKIKKSVRDALIRNAEGTDKLIPLDWMENNCPCKWLLNGEKITISWFNKEISPMTSRFIEVMTWGTR